MSNRLEPTAITTTIARQTPKNDFGEVLSRTVNGMARIGGAIIGTVGGSPVVSAAVSAVTSFANSGGRVPAQTVNTAQGALPVAPVPGASPATGSSLGGMSGPGPDSYGNGLVESVHQASLQSLHMQMAMQQESREYNAISNVLKVRHDSAKAAINNIR